MDKENGPLTKVDSFPACMLDARAYNVESDEDINYVQMYLLHVFIGSLVEPITLARIHNRLNYIIYNHASKLGCMGPQPCKTTHSSHKFAAEKALPELKRMINVLVSGCVDDIESILKSYDDWCRLLTPAYARKLDLVYELNSVINEADNLKL